MECNIQHKNEIILCMYLLALSKVKEVINFKSAIWIQVIEMHKILGFLYISKIPYRCLLRVFEIVMVN